MMEEGKGAAYSRAIKLLSKQDYSEFKIRTKLQALGLEEDQVDLAIEKVKKENFLNDERLKKNLVKKLIQKGYSPSFIRQKLECDGLFVKDDQILTIYGEEMITPKDQIKMLAEKKFNKSSIPNNSEVERQKVIRKVLTFILAKGHDFDETLSYLEDHF
jgi:SOS response regulatory protein OraA/RecX